MHGGGRGTTARYMQLNRHILDCGSTGELCELIETHAEEFNAVNVATAFRKLLQSRRDGVPRGLAERATQALEAAALRRMDNFKAQQVANILHIMAKTRYRPWDAALVLRLEGRAEALAGTFNAQNVANTLWAYATMGREPGERVCVVYWRINQELIGQKPVNACVHTYTEPQTSSTRSPASAGEYMEM